MFDDLLDANHDYAAGFSLQGLAPQAAKGLCLITCMDTRIEPLPMLGLVPGDAKILRNAGGRVMPEVLRSVVLATAFLGVTRVAVMHHTDCAMTKLDADAVASQLGPQRAEACEQPRPHQALCQVVLHLRQSNDRCGRPALRGPRRSSRRSAE